MSARTLAYRTSSFALFREIFYTLAQLGLEPKAAAHVPPFEVLRDDLKTIVLQEIDILEQFAKAQATIDRTDANLDRFSTRVVNDVDESTDGNTRKQIRAKLLKGKSPSRFRRPVLGRQLQEMSDWSEVLSKCGVAALAVLAPEASAQYEAGLAAAKLRDTVQSNNRSFRDVGARKQFIDKLNAERQETEGALAKLPFQDPSLPQDFAGYFFMREPPRDEEETIEDVRASIKSLKAQLAEEEARLVDMEREAADAAQRAKDEAESNAEADALEAQAAELLKQAAAKRKR